MKKRTMILSTVRTVIRWIVTVLLCAVFYQCLSYLIPRNYALFRIITEESAPRLTRYLLVGFGILYGYLSYRTKHLFLAQLPHLAFCAVFRYITFVTPHMRHETETTNEVGQTLSHFHTDTPAEPVTVPVILQMAVDTLIPVGFSFLIGYCFAKYREECHAAGKDVILFDSRQIRRNKLQ